MSDATKAGPRNVTGWRVVHRGLGRAPPGLRAVYTYCNNPGRDGDTAWHEELPVVCLQATVEEEYIRPGPASPTAATRPPRPRRSWPRPPPKPTTPPPQLVQLRNNAAARVEQLKGPAQEAWRIVHDRTLTPEVRYGLHRCRADATLAGFATAQRALAEVQAAIAAKDWVELLETLNTPRGEAP